MIKLAAVILTFNEAHNIEDCVNSLVFADHVLVVDSFSHDETVELAKKSRAEVVQREFDDYASQRNWAIDSLRDRAEWILFIDADERVNRALADEILGAMEKPGYAGWRMPRHNYIFGKLTLGAGWYPDYQTRLLRVGFASYDSKRKVHETVVLNGAEGALNEPLMHNNYKTVRQFLDKQRKYTAFEAGILFESGVRPKPQNYILQPLRHFYWRYVSLSGYRDGFHGLRLCILMAWYEFRKYLILRQLCREKS